MVIVSPLSLTQINTETKISSSGKTQLAPQVTILLGSQLFSLWLMAIVSGRKEFWISTFPTLLTSCPLLMLHIRMYDNLTIREAALQLWGRRVTRDSSYETWWFILTSSLFQPTSEWNRCQSRGAAGLEVRSPGFHSHLLHPSVEWP